MKYESEVIHEILEQRGHELSSLHYQSECVETWINETKGAYPKLCDYQSEWLNYILENPIGNFPYETITTNSTSTINNVVPLAYKSAILKGSTKHRDIDTGEVLDAFEDGRNLELVSVKMPVLTTTGKNLCDINKYIHGGIRGGGSGNTMTFSKDKYRSYYIECKPSTTYTIRVENSNNRFGVGSSHTFSEDTPFTINAYWLATSGDVTGQTLQRTFTTTEKDKYLYVYVANNGVFNPDIRVQVEESSTATSYEPHKSNILTVNEDVTLRGVGDVKDELNLLTGELTQRIGEVVLDGSEDETWNNTLGNHYVDQETKAMCLPKSFIELPVVNTGKTNTMVNNFKVLNTGYTNGQGYGVMTISTHDTWHIQFVKQGVKTVEKWREFLQSNPIKIKYQLTTESVKTVDLMIINQDGETISKIKPFEGTMNIEVKGTPIAPTATLEIPVEAITQNLNSFIEEE